MLWEEIITFDLFCIHNRSILCVHAYTYIYILCDMRAVGLCFKWTPVHIMYWVCAYKVLERQRPSSTCITSCTPPSGVTDCMIFVGNILKHFRDFISHIESHHTPKLFRRILSPSEVTLSHNHWNFVRTICNSLYHALCHRYSHELYNVVIKVMHFSIHAVVCNQCLTP